MAGGSPIEGQANPLAPTLLAKNGRVSPIEGTSKSSRPDSIRRSPPSEVAIEFFPMEDHMKKITSFVFPAILMILSASIACSLFMPTVQPTEESEPDFGPTGGPLKFTPDDLPDAQVGNVYDEEIRVTLNNTPVGDFFISEGTLPEGLEFTFLEGEDAATITGTPTEAGTFSFTVSAWCFGTQVSGQTGDKSYSLIVNP